MLHKEGREGIIKGAGVFAPSSDLGPEVLLVEGVVSPERTRRIARSEEERAEGRNPARGEDADEAALGRECAARVVRSASGTRGGRGARARASGRRRGAARTRGRRRHGGRGRSW